MAGVGGKVFCICNEIADPSAIPNHQADNDNPLDSHRGSKCKNITRTVRWAL